MTSKFMAKRAQNESSIRKLTKLGKKSLAVTIPIEIIREFGWREKQKVVVKKSGKKIVIEDWK
jgi:bifunctional DNA-binding transcriptional regulator/antitoxin component of YhaV-PrlF toxin-antitoxin module